MRTVEFLFTAFLAVLCFLGAMLFAAALLGAIGLVASALAINIFCNEYLS